MFARDDVQLWFIREELSKWLNIDISPWTTKEELSKLATRESLTPWLWANLVPEHLGPKIPPDFVLDPKFTSAEAENIAIGSKVTPEEPKKQTFNYTRITTRHCVDDDLAFSEGLAKIYARILEDKGEKVFLKGNIFLSKLAKAVFEQNANLFAETCGKYADEKYFRECAKSAGKLSFVVEEKFNKASWLNLYEIVLLLTEEYLATKCKLPKLSVFECKDNNENSDILEIVVAKQNSSESELDDAAWVPLKERDFDDSSDELKVGELFYEFLGKNFPFKDSKEEFSEFMGMIYGEDVCKNLDWLYKDLSKNSLPRAEFKADAMEDEDMLGRHDGDTVYINQRLVLDAISLKNPNNDFILFLTMLIEYGHFLGNVLRGEANKSADGSKKVGRAFARSFMKCTDADLFSADFEFADFTAPDAAGGEQRFTLEVSDLNLESRKKIFHDLGTEKIWEGEV